MGGGGLFFFFRIFFFFFFFNVWDQIWHKNEQNYMANIIMNVPGKFFQLTHCFPSKQGLAINLLWPTLQNKQYMYIELFYIISWSVWILILLAENIPSYRRGGGQIFVKRFDGLVCVYKNTDGMPCTCLTCLNANFISYATQLPWAFFFVTIYSYKLLQTFLPKASVENSSAQWAIFLLIWMIVFNPGTGL